MQSFVSYLNGIVIRGFLEKSQFEKHVLSVGNESNASFIPNRTYRTHNRNRSLSFINSDQLVNVNKGSRQIKPVTLGKRLALMIGHQVNLDCLSTAMIE